MSKDEVGSKSMMEVGKVYENRNGKYKVHAIERGVATINYINEDGHCTLNRAHGSVELLERIHQNIEIERKPRVEVNEANSKDADLLIMTYRLLEAGCWISARCHPNAFRKLERRYNQITGGDVTEEHSYVSVKDYYWECVAMTVRFNNHVPCPVSLHPRTSSDGQTEVGNTSLGWRLITAGCVLGPNKGSGK